MMRIEKQAWAAILGHAGGVYPNECCGAMLGLGASVAIAVPLENAYQGSQTDRYEIRPEDLLAVDRQRARGTGVDRYLPLPSRLRGVFLRDRLEEFLPLVLVPGGLDPRGPVPFRAELPAQCRPNGGGAGRPFVSGYRGERMPKILIPTPLRQYADNQSEIELTGTTVGELLDALSRQHGELRRHLYSDAGKLRSFVNIYVNDEDIRHLEREATPVGATDTVSIVPSIGWRRDRSGGDREPLKGRDSAVQPPPDHPRGRDGGTAQAQAGESAADRGGRSRIATRPVPGGRRAWAASVWWISMSWTSRTCSGR